MDGFEEYYLVRGGENVPTESVEISKKQLGKNVLNVMVAPFRAINYNKFTRYVAGITVIAAGLSVFGDYKWRSYEASAHQGANKIGVEIADGFDGEIATKQTALNAARSVVKLCNQDDNSKNRITNPFATGICDMAEQLIQDEQSSHSQPVKLGPPVHQTTPNTTQHMHSPAPILAQGSARP
jgi:hypothetical protein